MIEKPSVPREESRRDLSVDERREKVRSYLAVLMFALFAGMSAAAGALAFSASVTKDQALLLTSALSGVTGIFGSVIGFYFGALERRN